YCEVIVPRPEVGVERLPPGPRLLPTRIEAVEPILKASATCDSQVGGGEVELNARTQRRQVDLSAHGILLALGDEILQHDSRWDIVGDEVLRINREHTPIGPKP